MKKARAVVTNDPRRLAGIAMHSAHGRRFRDIAEEVMKEFGPDAPTTKVRELSTLRMTLEGMQSAAIAGDPNAADTIVRLSHSIARLESSLRRRRAAQVAMTPPANSLANIIARHRREADEAARRAAAATPAPPAGDGGNGGSR
ncbi:MAG: hypothetical protein CTY36_02725 [Methylocystis sp.]|nr:MAG: hypothetical protein CTY36_02725 [Methylocystis sp.]